MSGSIASKPCVRSKEDNKKPPEGGYVRCISYVQFSMGIRSGIYMFATLIKNIKTMNENI